MVLTLNFKLKKEKSQKEKKNLQIHLPTGLEKQVMKETETTFEV